MRAKYHNARICTLNDVDCWIGVIFPDEPGVARLRNMSPELDTEAEVVGWCELELRKRGVTGPLEIVNTTYND